MKKIFLSVFIVFMSITTITFAQKKEVDDSELRERYLTEITTSSACQRLISGSAQDVNGIVQFYHMPKDFKSTGTVAELMDKTDKSGEIMILPTTYALGIDIDNPKSEKNAVTLDFNRFVVESFVGNEKKSVIDCKKENSKCKTLAQDTQNYLMDLNKVITEHSQEFVIFEFNSRLENENISRVSDRISCMNTLVTLFKDYLDEQAEFEAIPEPLMTCKTIKKEPVGWGGAPTPVFSIRLDKQTDGSLVANGSCAPGGCGIYEFSTNITVTGQFVTDKKQRVCKVTLKDDSGDINIELVKNGKKRLIDYKGFYKNLDLTCVGHSMNELYAKCK